MKIKVHKNLKMFSIEVVGMIFVIIQQTLKLNNVNRIQVLSKGMAIIILGFLKGMRFRVLEVKRVVERVV